MMDYNALFKISYGLYIVATGDDKEANGFVSNTVFQITSEPAQFAASCNKDNFTAHLLEKYGHFSVSVLHQNTDQEIIKKFGYKSGKDISKMEGVQVKYGQTGTPIVLDESAAYLEFKIVNKFDMGTHWLFIGELIDAQILDNDHVPMTYAFYRDVKKGFAPKNAPTYIDKSKLKAKEEPKASGKWECTVCGHIYDEEVEGVKFQDLPDDWECPDCGAAKEDFIQI